MTNEKFFRSHPAHDIVCALYTLGTGKIVFTNRFTALGKASRPSDDELEKEARQAYDENIKRFGATHTTGEKLAALIIPGEKFLPGHTFSVDPKNKTLIAQPRSRQTG